MHEYTINDVRGAIARQRLVLDAADESLELAKGGRAGAQSLYAKLSTCCRAMQDGSTNVHEKLAQLATTHPGLFGPEG